MSKNFMSGMLDTMLAAKMKMQDSFQSMGRAWAADTAKKQKLYAQGKYRPDN